MLALQHVVSEEHVIEVLLIPLFRWCSPTITCRIGGFEQLSTRASGWDTGTRLNSLALSFRCVGGYTTCLIFLVATLSIKHDWNRFPDTTDFVKFEGSNFSLNSNGVQ